MPAPRINSIVESCLHSDDLARSTRFYRDDIGLRLLVSNERMSVLSVADKQVLLLFLRDGTHSPVPTPGGLIPPHGGSGDLHLAFAIAAADFDAWENHLISRGIPIESKVRWPEGGQSIYFRDPDNHLIELATPGLWEIY